MPMTRELTRRGLLGTAASAGVGVVGTADRAAAIDSISVGQSGNGWSAKGTLQRYDDEGRNGALLGNVYGYSPDAVTVGDLHTLVWDGEVTRDVREDAHTSEVNVTVARIEEAIMENRIPVSNGTVDLFQQVLACHDWPALLVESEVTLPEGGDYTLCTLANPGIGDRSADPAAGDEAWVTSVDGYDAVVATDGGEYYLAFAQKQDWRREFDGQRIGDTTLAQGPDRSAWQDVYREGDGWIDSNEENAGRIDCAFGLYAGERDSMEWLTAVAFGRSERTALERAAKTLDNGYETERNKYVPWLE